MIKFTALVHKETGEVIRYEDWEKRLKLDMWFISTNSKKNKQFNYKPKEMLFSDDFEIIYDSEFTLEELESVREHIKDENKDLKAKVSELIGEREYIKNKYGIEV